MIREIYENDLTLRSDKWVPYFDVYEFYLKKFINKSPVIVEIGVQGGGSLQMWRKYLGDGAEIYGIDVDESILKHKEYYDEKTHLFIGDQGSDLFWDDFLAKVPKIDILIDDGGHFMNQQKKTFERVFPHINYGGVFICEDTHTSYEEYCGGGLKNPNSFIEYCKNLIDLLHYNHLKERYSVSGKVVDLCAGLSCVNFYNSMVVMEKQKPEKFERIIVNDK